MAYNPESRTADLIDDELRTYDETHISIESFLPELSSLQIGQDHLLGFADNHRLLFEVNYKGQTILKASILEDPKTVKIEGIGEFSFRQSKDKGTVVTCLTKIGEN